MTRVFDRMGKNHFHSHAAENRRIDAALRDDEVREQLNRILVSSAFRYSLRLRRFLSFVVEETLAGRAGRIKAYTIAVEALGRGDDFDPQSDPIVRVEASRLRHALKCYYDDERSDDRLVIELPLGSYVPLFRPRARPKEQPRVLSFRDPWHGRGDHHPECPEEIVARSGELYRSLEAYKLLLALQAQQIAAFGDAVVSAQQTLERSHALLREALAIGEQDGPQPAAQSCADPSQDEGNC